MTKDMKKTELGVLRYEDLAEHPTLLRDRCEDLRVEHHLAPGYVLMIEDDPLRRVKVISRVEFA